MAKVATSVNEGDAPLMDWDLEVDALVTGAGACGLVAASRLAEAGLDVVVVEKMGEISGNTALSQGMIPAAGTRFQIEAGIEDTPDTLFEDIMHKNGRTSDPDVTRAVSEYARQAVEWLVDACQVELSLCTDFNYPGFSHIRMHAPPSRSGKDLLRALESHVKKQRNVTLAMGAPLTSIILDDADSTKVAGVEILQNGESVRVKAEMVILACNGFGANKEMVQAFIPQMADALYFGHEGNAGDALLLARVIGAEWASMQGFQGHASVAVPHGVLITWGTVMTGGILLNALGQRFTNELQGYSEMSLEVMAQPEGIAFELFDQDSYDAAISISDFRTAVEVGAVRRFDLMEEYAAAFGLPAAAVVDTLRAYNASINPSVYANLSQSSDSSNIVASTGKRDDSRLDSFRRPERRSLHAPYYGVRIGPALFHTQGGLKINQHAQVMKVDGRYFQNLYAGGGAAEGLSGSHPKGYLSGNGLLSAVTLGYIAGSHAATSRRC